MVTRMLLVAPVFLHLLSLRKVHAMIYWHPKNYLRESNSSWMKAVTESTALV